MFAKAVCCLLISATAVRVRYDEQHENAINEGMDEQFVADAEIGAHSAAKANSTASCNANGAARPPTIYASITADAVDLTQLAGQCPSSWGFAGQVFAAGVNFAGGPAWAQAPAFQRGFHALVAELNDIMEGGAFPPFESANKKGKKRVQVFNSEFLASVHHTMVFFSIPREAKESSNKAAAHTTRDDRHGIRMLPTAALQNEPFLERSPLYRRHCCCKGNAESCKWKYTTPETQCKTGFFSTNHDTLKADAVCFNAVKNPDPNDAPPPGHSTSDEVPRECRRGESQRGPDRFCMGDDVQRDCGVACHNCAVVIQCR